MGGRIKVGSDFSGVGAFNQALIRLGIDFEEVFACDMDKYARQTFIHNYGEPAYYPTNVYEREIPSESLDIYMTSPPCQAFSLAGKRLGKDDKRGILFFNSHEFIQVNKPRYFIFENVKGLLSDDGGKTFSEWVNLLGGKSVNGNAVLFPYDDAVPYHLYWQVLNAKEHGVPQNRERVFLVGIRDDADNNFRFPVEEHLKKRLKDVLEDEVDEKYFLSESAINKCTKSQANENMLNEEIPDKSRCIVAGYYKVPFDGQYLKIKSATSKGYEEATEGDSINLAVPNSETRRGRVGKGVAQTLDTGCQQGVIVHNIPEIVSVRKHEVDILKLQQCLKRHKNKSIKSIAQELNVPKTQVEHWFRIDKHFAIPNSDIWFELKKSLNITTNEFDLSITEFEEKESVFEKGNRVYDERGIAPTMTSTSADERILLNTGCQQGVIQLNPSLESGGKQPYQQNRVYDSNGLCPALNAGQVTWGGNAITLPNDYKIRRLTPRECFRLMDFPDTFTWPVSDSQAYKQAGNSIVVNVLYKILKNLRLS